MLEQKHTQLPFERDKIVNLSATQLPLSHLGETNARNCSQLDLSVCFENFDATSNVKKMFKNWKNARNRTRTRAR